MVPILFLSFLLVLLLSSPAPGAEPSQRPVCAAAGRWLDPATGAVLAPDRLFADLARRDVVLLGETHDEAEHHRWQTYTLAALRAHRPALAVGFEMFPRGVQVALDRWSRGGLSVDAFLAESRWREVWSFDPELYLPLFHFVRQNRLPMLALNVERTLVSRVRREGWAAIPEAERAGLSDPVPASDPYRRFLAEVFAEAHLDQESDQLPDVEAVLARADFARFVDAQLTWDRAMAEALLQARREHPEALLVGIVGSGHLRFGHGVPRQLADLGLSDTAVLLPLEAGAACDALPPEIAEAVFLVEPSTRIDLPESRLRLGVTVAPAERGLRVESVMPGSIAEKARLMPGDLVLEAAGLPLARPSDLVEIVARLKPGTWLPLEIERDGTPHKLVARFPRGG